MRIVSVSSTTDSVTTMTNDAGASARRARRREVVTLSVVASSAITFAATWLGIVAIDGAPTASVALASQPAAFEVAGGEAVGVPPTGGALVPAPVPQRPVAVVRRSRAS